MTKTAPPSEEVRGGALSTPPLVWGSPPERGRLSAEEQLRTIPASRGTTKARTLPEESAGLLGPGSRYETTSAYAPPSG